jgi:hypothetical protein
MPLAMAALPTTRASTPGMHHLATQTRHLAPQTLLRAAQKPPTMTLERPMCPIAADGEPERLVPCAACSRHVRWAEVKCPFCGADCGAAVSSGPPPHPPPDPFQRLAAAAVVAAGMAVTSCSAKSGTSGIATSGIAPYGSPPSVGVAFFDASLPSNFDGSLAIGSTVIGSNNLACTSSASCLPGDVCCVDFQNSASGCQPGPCTSTSPAGIGPLQLCGISAECLVQGDVCGSPTQSIQVEFPPGTLICNAPGDGGTPNDAGIDADASPNGGEAGDDDSGASDAGNHG